MAGRSPPDDFARLVGRVLAAADRVAPRHGEPTEFELLTAVVFARFAEVRPDLALVEVGLGGRLDATHAWDGGVAVVTNVDLDHMDRLGDTVTKIAREKAAIIERGDLAVTGASGDGLAVIRRRARRMGVPLTEVEAAPLLGWDRDGIEVELPRLGPTRVGLRGRHQAANVAIADATLDALEAAGIATVPDDGAAARATPTRSGRAGWSSSASGDRDVLLDGAHNPAGAAALAVALDDLRPFLAAGPITLVTASMADKDVDGVIAALGRSKALDGATVVCTSLDVPRAMPAAELAARWRTGVVWGERVVAAAPDREADPAGPSSGPRRPGPVVVAGSLYLVGAVRGDLVDDPALRDPDPARGQHDRSPRPPPSRALADRPGTFRWGERTFVMGILNVTPDSFSGDGLLAERGEGGGGAGAPDPSRPPSRRGRRMVAEGADLLDIGGESTRPGHDPSTPTRSGAGSCRSSRPSARPSPTPRSASTRPSRPSPKPRWPPAPTSSTTSGASATTMPSPGSPPTTASRWSSCTTAPRPATRRSSPS